MARTSFFWRLYGSFLALLVVAIVLGVVLADQRAARVTERRFELSLHEQAILVRQLLTPSLALLPDAGGSAEIQALLDQRPRSLDPRITVVLPDGRVIADSSQRPERMDNHADREEFVEARSAEYGTAHRRSATLNMNMMYVAVPYTRNGEIVAFVRTAATDRVIQEARQEVQWLLALIATLTLLITVVIGYAIGRRILDPLRRLTETAWAIAGGDDQRRISTRAPGEVGTLAVAFQRVLDRMRQHVRNSEIERARIEAILRSMSEGVIAIDRNERILYINDAARRLFHVGAEGDAGSFVWEVIRSSELVEALLRTLREKQDDYCEVHISRGLTDVVLEVHTTVLKGEGKEPEGALVVFGDTSELRKLRSFRTDFVSNVSHEMKTPVAAIRGLVESILDDEAMPDQVRLNFLQRIQSQTARLTSLVNDLMQLSAAESGRLSAESAADLRSAVRQSVQAHQRAAEEKGVEVEDLTADKGRVLVAGEIEFLRHIVDNLLSNAIRYSREGGRVRLSIEENKGSVVLAVADNGIGIEPVDQERIFERFFRVDKARSRELGGTGLGLAIVKHTVQALGGQIELESEPGRGTTFRVSLRRRDEEKESQIKTT